MSFFLVPDTTIYYHLSWFIAATPPASVLASSLVPLVCAAQAATVILLQHKLDPIIPLLEMLAISLFHIE